MAGRAPVDEKPFRPLGVSVLNSVMHHRPEARGTAAVARPEPAVIELSTPARPVAAHGEAVIPKSMLAIPPLQRLDQEKRILFTREETQALDRLVNTLAMRLRTQVKASHVLRALTSLLLEAEAQLDQRAGESGSLTRPANGDFAALQRFEWELSVIIAHALRDAGLPKACRQE